MKLPLPGRRSRPSAMTDMSYPARAALGRMHESRDAGDG